MWIIGAIIAAAGMQVYIVWGSVGLLILLYFPKLIISFRLSRRMAERKTTSNICSESPNFSLPLYLPQMVCSWVRAYNIIALPSI